MRSTLNMMNPLGTMLFALLCLITTPIFAQQSVFNIGVVAGANISRIGTYDRQPLDTKSDKFFQTTHHGLNAGIIATMQVSTYSQIGMEFLFSQNGKYVNTEPIFENRNVDIFINYLEVPIHYNWQSNLSRKTDFNNFHFEAGVAYARLLSGSSKFIKRKINQDPNFFKKEKTFLLQSGMTFYFTERFGLNLKASMPIDTGWTGLTFAARWVVLIRK